MGHRWQGGQGGNFSPLCQGEDGLAATPPSAKGHLNWSPQPLFPTFPAPPPPSFSPFTSLLWPLPPLSTPLPPLQRIFDRLWATSAHSGATQDDVWRDVSVFAWGEGCGKLGFGQRGRQWVGQGEGKGSGGGNSGGSWVAWGMVGSRGGIRSSHRVPQPQLGAVQQQQQCD